MYRPYDVTFVCIEPKGSLPFWDVLHCIPRRKHQKDAASNFISTVNRVSGEKRGGRRRRQTELKILHERERRAHLVADRVELGEHDAVDDAPRLGGRVLEERLVEAGDLVDRLVRVSK